MFEHFLQFCLMPLEGQKFHTSPLWPVYDSVNIQKNMQYCYIPHLQIKIINRTKTGWSYSKKMLVFSWCHHRKNKVDSKRCKQLVGYAASRYRLTLAFTYFLEAINQVERVKENWKRSLKIREVRTAIWTLFRYFSFAISPTYRMERIQQNHSWIRR